MSLFDTPYGGYSLRERIDIFLGRDAGLGVWACRAAWFAFACWTMSMHGNEVYMSPGVWAGLVIAYYFYF